jgi:hypothetical protein
VITKEKGRPTTGRPNSLLTVSRRRFGGSCISMTTAYTLDQGSRYSRVERAMSSNPHGYGEVVYDQPGKKKKEDKTPFDKGALVVWKMKHLHGTVLEDWKDYGVQIQVEDDRGQITKHRVRREELERATVLDILARI